MNGRPVTELAGYQVFDILHGPVGTSLDLAIKRGAELRHVTLVLRELAF